MANELLVFGFFEEVLNRLGNDAPSTPPSGN